MSALPKSIYKYELRPAPSAGVQILELPTHAQILDCKMLDGRLYLWALVDTTEPTTKRAFRVYPTGGEMSVSPGRHVGTVVQRADWGVSSHYVWHVFEVPAC